MQTLCHILTAVGVEYVQDHVKTRCQDSVRALKTSSAQNPWNRRNNVTSGVLTVGSQVRRGASAKQGTLDSAAIQVRE